MTIDRNKSEELIIELNASEMIIDERKESAAFDSKRMFALLPETIADKRTLLMVEIHDLFKAFDQTETWVGSARLFHSMANPSESIELIHAKHDSFCELTGNDSLREAITIFLRKYRQGEADLFRFLNAHGHPLFIYKDIRQVRRLVETLRTAARAIPQPETVYLDSLIKNILNLNHSPIPDLLNGPTYRTLRGLQSKKEKGRFTPGFRFRPGRISIGTLLPFLPVTIFSLAWLTGLMEPAMAKSMTFFTAWFSILGLTYGGVLKPYLDWETAILPLRERLLHSDHFSSAVEAVAAIDELVSFVAYSEEMDYPTVIPDIANEPVHSFKALDLRNPIISKESGSFIPNDAELEGAVLTFITGPNSGGKTTFCKTIVQNQILGQIGAPMAARFAAINMADRITYQAPAFDTLSDLEGRFGTELKETRDIFFETTPKSLVVLDEIAEGTTSHEKLALSEEIMNGFQAIGNTTLMVTHNFELVERFQNTGKGNYLQVEFDGEKPTHKIVAGISKESHALRVARKIGFAPEDIQRHLAAKQFSAEKTAKSAGSSTPHQRSCQRRQA